MDVMVVNAKGPSMDNGLIDNRSKLLRLAETIKPTRRKPPPPRKALSLKEDPSYTNIEHLVFGTYHKNRTSTSTAKVTSVVVDAKGEEEEEEDPPTLRPGSEMIRNRRSAAAAVPLKAGCYHSLDRSRLLTTSSSRALPTDSHANITLLHVEYPPSTTTTTDVVTTQVKQQQQQHQQKGIAAAKNQHKITAYVARPPTQQPRSHSEFTTTTTTTTSEGSRRKEPVVVCSSSSSSHLPRTKRTGSRDSAAAAEPTTTTTLIAVNATTTNRITTLSTTNRGCQVHDPICSSSSSSFSLAVCATNNGGGGDEADSSSSSLNTSMLTTTTTNSSLYLSGDSLDDSSEELPPLPTPHPPSPVQPSSSNSRRSVSSILSTQRNNSNLHAAAKKPPADPTKLAGLQRSSSMVAPNGAKKAQHVKLANTCTTAAATSTGRQQSKETVGGPRRHSHRAVGKGLVVKDSLKLDLSRSNSSLDSNESSNGTRTTTTGRRHSTVTRHSTNTSSSSSKIPTKHNHHHAPRTPSSVATQKQQHVKDAAEGVSGGGPRRSKTVTRKATTTTTEAKRPSSSSSQTTAEVHDDPVTCVKTLTQENPRPSSRTSPERYSLERPNRALYTWYETRRRPSLTAAQQSPWQPETQQSSSDKWRASASLPKSLMLGREKVATTGDDKRKQRRQSMIAFDGTATNGHMKPRDCFSTRQGRSSPNHDRPSAKENEAPSVVLPSPDTFRHFPDEAAPPTQEADGQHLVSPSQVSSKDEGRTTECPVTTTTITTTSTSPTGGGSRSSHYFILPREKSLNKTVRRLKASSSPAAFVGGGPRGDMSASDSDLRRPWSQIYTEDEAERALASTTCILDGAGASCADLSSATSTTPLSPSSPSATPTCRGLLLPSFTARCSSLRAANHQPISNTPVESVLQKFRKSFSLRFYRNKRPPSPSSTVTSVLSDRPPTPAPLHATTGSEGSASTFSVDDDTEVSVFKFGPLVWRSSKEKRQKNRKGGVNCNSPDSGIQVEGSPRRPQPVLPPTPPPSSTPSSPGVIPRRGKSSSLRLDRPHRPLSDAGNDYSSSILLSDSKLSIEDRRVVRRTYSDLSGSHRFSERPTKSESRRAVPPLMKMKSEKRISVARIRRHHGKLRRSISQPMEMEKLTSMNSLAYLQGLSDTEDNSHECSSISSEGEASSDGETSICSVYKWIDSANMEGVMYAEALWDHVTMDSIELPMKVGDLVTVLECNNKHWWWGKIGNRVGLFPASFVRPRVNQISMRDDFAIENIHENETSKPSQEIGTVLNSSQMRTNVIQEIIATERDFVQHLKDVIEGYLKQMRKRVDMFPEERINVIFGNIEQIYHFQKAFLTKLEDCINNDDPHMSQLGACFVDHKGFQIYSDYCNNHPHAVHELQELYTIPKYACFFEACRLLQDMIDISLDGFLLTPIQKICKYPLQLAELLKYTPTEHPDRYHVMEALETMRQVAQYINERKRRMECVEKLATWQLSVEYWEGPDLLDSSSQLIHSSDVTKLSSSWSREVTLFLFDHQLIICKKDLIKRNTYCYKSRVDLDKSEVLDLPDGRDTQSGLTVKYAWRLFCAQRNKWYTFCTKTQEEKNQWMKAFKEERQQVKNDEAQGFAMSEKIKREATKLAKHKLKRAKGKNGKEFPSRRMPSMNVINHHMLKMKAGSLPHGIILNKKKNSGWFTFGSGKKLKR